MRRRRRDLFDGPLLVAARRCRALTAAADPELAVGPDGFGWALELYDSLVTYLEAKAKRIQWLWAGFWSWTPSQPALDANDPAATEPLDPLDTRLPVFSGAP